MKKRLHVFFSFFYVLLLVAPGIMHVGKYAHFVINPDSFIENYCVNKSKPELNCKGACALKEEFALDQDLDNHEKNHLPSELRSQFSLSLFFQQDVFRFVEGLKSNKLYFSFLQSVSEYYGMGLLKPPISVASA